MSRQNIAKHLSSALESRANLWGLLFSRIYQPQHTIALNFNDAESMKGKVHKCELSNQNIIKDEIPLIIYPAC